MKSVYHFFLTTCVLLLVACSSDEELALVDDSQTCYTATLRLDGDIQHFDVPSRATTSDWEDGAQLYIQYHTANGNVDGIATYNENMGEWTVNYYGSIARNETSPCEVYYFENPQSINNDSISLNYSSVVFADQDATYLYKDGVVIIKVHLIPQTGRIRFHGTEGYSFSFVGLKWINYYNITTNTFSYYSEPLTLTCGADGYTPYVYASFANDSTRKLSVDCSDGQHTLNKNFDETVLALGKSGFIDVPTMESRNGWQMIEKDPLGLCINPNHPHQIDMGNGIIWSCCNVGATTPVERGDYFAWGETKSKTTYNWKTYTLCNGSRNRMTKYVDDSYFGNVDNKTQLEMTDDAAHVNRGETWRMPTIEEMSELEKNCSWRWITINNVSGYSVTSINGNALFFPAAGSRDHESGYYSSAGYGAYWSSSLVLGYNREASCLWFSNDNIFISSTERYEGLKVRPVMEKPNY